MAFSLTQLSRPVLGTFSKGESGSAQLSLAQSGGRHCSTTCRHHPKNGGGCYAVRTEARPDRRNIRTKLERHEATEPELIFRRARGELVGLIAQHEAHGLRMPWFRFAAFGSLPGRPTLQDLAAFRELVATATAGGVPVHLPLETPAKANKYTAAMAGLKYNGGPLDGLEPVARLSLSRVRPGPVSVPSSQVAGAPGTKRVDAVEQARHLVRHESERGGRGVVCPAVLTSPKFAGKRDTVRRIKCGKCTACADPRVSLIVYPHH